MLGWPAFSYTSKRETDAANRWRGHVSSVSRALLWMGFDMNKLGKGICLSTKLLPTFYVRLHMQRIQRSTVWVGTSARVNLGVVVSGSSKGVSKTAPDRKLLLGLSGCPLQKNGGTDRSSPKP